MLMRQAAPPAGMPTFPKHICAIKDNQVGLFATIMCLALKTAYLERKAAADLGKEPWQQANALPSLAVQRLMEISGSADLEAFVAAKSFTDLVILPPRHRT